MRWLIGILAFAVFITCIAHFVLLSPTITFVGACVALILLSKFLGEATQQVARHVGDTWAGLINVTMGNFAEIVIVWSSLRAGYVELAKAEIVGSMMGNLLFVMGLSIVVGCRGYRTLSFNHLTSSMYIILLTAVGILLYLPTAAAPFIAPEDQGAVTAIYAVLLVSLYGIFQWFQAKHPKLREARDAVRSQEKAMNHGWPLKRAIVVLVGISILAILMSELLVSEVKVVSVKWGISELWLGMIILSIVGNIAENWVAISAAYHQRPELSLAICVGSPAQVGMVVAPVAVLIGLCIGQPFTFVFTGVPVLFLGFTVITSILVLRDDQWNQIEGVLLIILYIALGTLVAFMKV